MQGRLYERGRRAPLTSSVGNRFQNDPSAGCVPLVMRYVSARERTRHEANITRQFTVIVEVTTGIVTARNPLEISALGNFICQVSMLAQDRLSQRRARRHNRPSQISSCGYTPSACPVHLLRFPSFVLLSGNDPANYRVGSFNGRYARTGRNGRKQFFRCTSPFCGRGSSWCRGGPIS